MQGRVAILLSFVVVLVLLVALNAASYVRVEPEAEFEIKPYRSTTNAGPTGTRALYDFLAQTGRETARWTLPASALLDVDAAARPATFVVVGETRTEFDDREARDLLRWVRQGGRLVVIDRTPDARLLPASAGWRVASQNLGGPGLDTRPDDAEDMTAGAPALRPAQPTLLTRDIERVSPSRFAGGLYVYKTAPNAVAVSTGTGGGIGPRPPRAMPPPTTTPTPTPRPGGGGGGGVGPGAEDEEEWWEEEDDDETPPKPVIMPPAVSVDDDDEDESVVGDVPLEPVAPVVHFTDGRAGEGALLVDYVYGLGRVVVLSDPYVVSNAGIGRADNLQLAVNVVAGPGGLVAFDEYHQGLGSTRNQTLAYFSGTPVLWMFGQGMVLVLAVVWAKSRRFARALPAPRVDRRSSLEFVSSMAELQERARAYDLAIENVYSRTRRALARYAGLPATAPRREIAARVAARSGRGAREVEALMGACEEAVEGAPLSGRKALALVAALRDLEGELGIRMREREIRQAGRK